MIIYKDFLSGDEIISDTYDLKEIDDVVYEVDCKMVTRGAVEVNTGSNAIDPANAPKGAEASGNDDAADADGMVEDTPEQVNNIIDGFRLNPKGQYPSKEIFRDSLLEYMQKLSASLKEKGVDEARVKEILSGMKKYAGKIGKKFQEYEPYGGENVDAEDQMTIFLNYRKDGVTPYFTIWKHGLTEMKV